MSYFCKLKDPTPLWHIFSELYRWHWALVLHLLLIADRSRKYIINSVVALLIELSASLVILFNKIFVPFKSKKVVFNNSTIYEWENVITVVHACEFGQLFIHESSELVYLPYMWVWSVVTVCFNFASCNIINLLVYLLCGNYMACLCTSDWIFRRLHNE